MSAKSIFLKGGGNTLFYSVLVTCYMNFQETAEDTSCPLIPHLLHISIKKKKLTTCNVLD